MILAANLSATALIAQIDTIACSQKRVRVER